MDVLRPPTVTVNGRCYRINESDFGNYNEKQSGVEWDDSPSNYGTECTGDEPCDAEEDFDIGVTDSGRFKTSFHVSSTYYGLILGAKAQTKKRLEDETKTVIRVPRSPQENEIVITGSNRKAVASARRRIEAMVMSSRRRQPFTHFLSIRMVSLDVKERYAEFKERVLKDCRARGVDETIFQDPNKLHLTLCTLVLMDNFERSKAAEVLERCKQDVIDPLMDGHSITILLSGVEYMNDDPSEVDVLYARVLSNEILQRLVDEIVDYCSNAGLIDKQFERVKLHVTIMNTKFRHGKSDNSTKSKTRETFDGSQILDMFGDFEFGEVSIDTIHLSLRYSTSKTDGYYQSSAQVSLLM